MKTKRCECTKTVTGCGQIKPLTDFQKIRKHLENYDSVCKNCRNKSRRKSNGRRIEPEIFDQFNQLMVVK